MNTHFKTLKSNNKTSGCNYYKSKGCIKSKIVRQNESVLLQRSKNINEKLKEQDRRASTEMREKGASFTKYLRESLLFT